jgi:hypothetical protein
MNSLKLAFLFLAAMAWLASTVPASAQEHRRFLFIGDMPYYNGRVNPITDDQFVWFEDIVAPKIRKSGFEFLVHYGDFKSRGIPCSENVFRDNYSRITGLLPGKPVFYTPGDNDWTDCDDPNDENPKREMVKAYSELSRLDLLRQIFFIEKPLKFSKEWQYERQPKYPENALWRAAKVQLATVHLVGTNNGRIDILMDDENKALARVEARDQANRDWLNLVFDRASAPGNRADAVIITTQADVTEPEGSGACTDTNPKNCDAFVGFISALISHAADFNKPVLLIHGDKFPYCLDKKFGGKLASKLWRLNAGGDFKTVLDATVVTFDAKNDGTPFSVNGLVVNLPLTESC